MSVFYVGVTGHRPPKIGGYAPCATHRGILSAMSKDLIRYRDLYHGPGRPGLVGITGMALGTDQLFAQCCIKLGIPFHAYIPCADQEKAWWRNPESIRLYHDILQHTAHIVWTNGRKPFTYDCMQARNVAMVAASNVMLAVWNGSSGGTANCVASARDAHVPVRILDPSSLGDKPTFTNDTQSGG